MDAMFEQRVREKAYRLWIEAGQVHGMAHEHWCAAEATMRHEHAQAAPLLQVSTSGCTAGPQGKVKASLKTKTSLATSLASKTSLAKPAATKTVEASAATSAKGKAPAAAKAVAAKRAVSKPVKTVVLTNAKPTAAQMVN